MPPQSQGKEAATRHSLANGPSSPETAEDGHASLNSPTPANGIADDKNRVAALDEGLPSQSGAGSEAVLTAGQEIEDGLCSHGMAQGPAAAVPGTVEPIDNAAAEHTRSGMDVTEDHEQVLQTQTLGKSQSWLCCHC